MAEESYLQSHRGAREDRNRPLEWFLTKEPNAKELLVSLELDAIANSSQLKNSTKHWRTWFEWLSPLEADEQLAWRAFIWLNDWSGQALSVSSFMGLEESFPELRAAMKTMSKSIPPAFVDSVSEFKWVMQLAVIMLAASICSLLPSPGDKTDADPADMISKQALLGLNQVRKYFYLICNMHEK
jgi:hypothetical protein